MEILGVGARRAGVVSARRSRWRCRPWRTPRPGYTTIFDGTATGSDASFDKWAQVGGGDIALQSDGTMRTSSGFGMRWYTVKPFGDVSLKVDYRDARTTEGYSNGGVLVRFPDPRTPAAQTPASWSYDWAGASGPFPPAKHYQGDPPASGRSRRPIPADWAPAWCRSSAARRCRSTTRRTSARRIRARPARSTASPTSTRRAPAPTCGTPGRGVAHDGDPHRRPAVHGARRRQGHQPVGRRGADALPGPRAGRPADDGAPARRRLHRPAGHGTATSSPTATCASRSWPRRRATRRPRS